MVNKHISSSNKGFTLIELLIVIVILAVFMTMGVSLYGNAQTGARDTVRKSDLQSIQKALEGHYMATAGTCDDPSATAATAGQYCPVQPKWFAKNAIPSDPKGGAYSYVGIPLSAPVDTFVLCAKLENATGNSSSGTAIVAPATPNTGQYYCVTGIEK